MADETGNLAAFQPDYDDAGWRHVVHDTETLACMDHAHDECSLPQLCRCECHGAS